MEQRKSSLIYLVILVAAILGAIHSLAYGSEKIGNLVFEAMEKVQTNNSDHKADFAQIRMDRKSAAAERDAVRRKFEKSRKGSLDRREFNAQYGYALAKVLKALYKEAQLTHEVAAKQLNVLYPLEDSIKATGGGVDGAAQRSIVKATKPVLNNGRALLASLAQYKDLIRDPAINYKLNAASQTARMLSKYVSRIERSRTDNSASHYLLRQKVAELIEQLKAVYVQTDIFMAMVKDKSTRLKFITEVAAADAARLVLTEGQADISRLSKGLMDAMTGELQSTEGDLDALLSDALESHGDGADQTGAQSWTRADF